MRVLVVDDDFRVAELHAQFVRRAAGFDVVGIAHNAAEARQAVVDLQPDLVLLDMYLPDGLGLDLVPELACDVLMVTAAADAETVRRAVGAGGVQFHNKMFSAAAAVGLPLPDAAKPPPPASG